MYRRGGACARRIGKDVTPMEPDYEALASLFPNIAAQLRSGLSNFYLAAAHLAPPEMREPQIIFRPPAESFNRTLVELADALPKQAFTQKYLD